MTHLQSPAPADPSDHLRLPQGVQDSLLQVAHRKTLVPGESLFLKGSAPDALFGVVRGALRVSVVAASGREAVIAMLEAGHWFGEVSLLVGQERVYDTYAAETTDMAVVAASDFHHLIATRPEVHMAFTKLVCQRLRQALVWIDDAILMPLPVRLARRLLTLDARADTPAGAANAVPQVLGVSQEDLAFMLGVSRQSVNRQLKLWEEQGVLQVDYRRIVLLNRAELVRQTVQGG